MTLLGVLPHLAPHPSTFNTHIHIPRSSDSPEMSDVVRPPAPLSPPHPLGINTPKVHSVLSRTDLLRQVLRHDHTHGGRPLVLFPSPVERPALSVSTYASSLIRSRLYTCWSQGTD